jgi:transposase
VSEDFQRRDVLVECGPWGRIYGLFRRWQRDGTWHQVLTRLQALADAKGAIVWNLSVDSTEKESPGGVFDEPDDHRSPCRL